MLSSEQRKILGIKLQFARLVKGVRQDQVADLLGMSQSFYSKIENGTRGELTLSQLFLCCKFFEISFKDCLEICIGVHAWNNTGLPQDISSNEYLKKMNRIRKTAEEEFMKKDEMIRKLKRQIERLERNGYC